MFEPAKESSLEYDLARLIYSLANPDKNAIGLLTSLPMNGGFDPQTQQPSQPWVINQQARQLFEVRNLPASFETIDDDISLLWIVHPTDLDEQTLYAIDQFILGGGRALIFVDPFAEVAATPGAMPGMPGMPGGATSSNLERLFAAWGLAYDPGQVVVDNVNALSVATGGLGARPVRHIGLLGLESAGIDPSDVVTAGLASVNLGAPGALAANEDAGIRLVPLLTSSAESTTYGVERFQFLPDPSSLLDDFRPSADEYVLAARVEGAVGTAFPDGPPRDDASDDEEGEAAAQVSGDSPNHLTAADDVNLIVVADVDILSDRLWVQRQRSIFGQQLASAFASNGDFVTNAIANLAGSADLIGLTSRATFARPFDTVEALRREADAQFRATEQQLQAELAETEQRLGELQAERDDTSSLLMSPEQQAELERFRDQQVRIRQDLRAVQRNLDSSIENLGVALKIINIAAMPLVLTLLALLVAFARQRKRG